MKNNLTVRHGFEGRAITLAEIEASGQVGSAHQVHSNIIASYFRHEHESIKSVRCDGLISNVPCTLAVQTADCIPVLMQNASGDVIAAVHAGWRGVLTGILPNAVRAFSNLNVRTNEITAYFGPSIQKCCFEIGQDVSEQFIQTIPFDISGSFSRSKNPDRKMLDLTSVASKQLIAAGMMPENIHLSGICTYCDPSGKYASYRKMTHAGIKDSARQWSWISNERRS